MGNLDRVNTMVEHFYALAKLQKKDLQDTQEMPNYNASFLKLLQMKKQLCDNNGFFNTKAVIRFETFFEMENEISKMIPAKELGQAKIIYSKMIQELEVVMNDLAQTDIPKPTPHLR